jgi:hypothetical protein
MATPWVPEGNDFVVEDRSDILQLRKHPAFLSGFPKLEVADYADLHEMMDVATCGYPFGDFLWNQVGSVTSSFTKGTKPCPCCCTIFRFPLPPAA